MNQSFSSRWVPQETDTLLSLLRAVLLSLLAHGLFLLVASPKAVSNQINRSASEPQFLVAVSMNLPRPAQTEQKIWLETNKPAQKKMPLVPKSDILALTEISPTNKEQPANRQPVKLGENGEVQELKLSLARFARHHKHYPVSALEAGWEGIVEVSMVYFPSSKQPVIQVQKSSGYEVLDNEAIHLVQAAFRQSAIPSSLRVQAFEVLLPIEFRLSQLP